jgi:RNA polymerase sigma factor (sigma-70 family)
VVIRPCVGLTGGMDDAMLLALVREGDDEAYGRLYARHRDIARRVARRVVGATEVDDVVADSFVAVLMQLRSGRGPTTSFRGYLLTTVRHEAGRRRAAGRRCEPHVDLDPAGRPGPDLAEHADVRDAYGTLPPRWRHVLWRLDVEGVPPRELAAELGVSPNAVSALGYRARAGLRAAYLRRSDAA